MYFLSMKFRELNNDIPLMSESNDDLSVLVSQAENMFELLTRHKSWDRSVIDDNFESRYMSDAGMDLINNKINDFEWKFLDKYDRNVKCYITSNV